MEKRKSMRRTLRVLAAAFLVVFLLRWAYALVFTQHDVVIQYTAGISNVSLGEKSNIASGRVKQVDAGGAEVYIDQKYDKTARLSAYTDQFDEANQKLRREIDVHQAVIQMEHLSGLAGSQQLDISIGVVPEQFDALVEALKDLATLRSFNVTKVDKTEEYRRLMAEIATLEKTRDTYTALKEQGGSLSDQLKLEEKILDVERQLQSIGVNAGLYATENSFCTVSLNLSETVATRISVRFVLNCAKDSFLWTLGAFFAVLVALCLALGIAWLLQAFSRFHDPKPREQGKPGEGSTKNSPPPADGESKSP